MFSGVFLVGPASINLKTNGEMYPENFSFRIETTKRVKFQGPLNLIVYFSEHAYCVGRGGNLRACQRGNVKTADGREVLSEVVTILRCDVTL